VYDESLTLNPLSVKAQLYVVPPFVETIVTPVAAGTVNCFRQLPPVVSAAAYPDVDSS
jgi:hypothetical protein